MKQFLIGLLSLLSFALIQTFPVHATSVTVHVGTAGETVVVRDVTKAFWQNNPRTELARETVQNKLAEQSPSTELFAQTQADQNQCATFDLPATHLGQQAAYRFEVTGDEQTVVVLMPKNGDNVSIWPKDIEYFPGNKPDTPNRAHHPNHHQHPRLPDTGDWQAIGLTAIGLGLLLSLSLYHRRMKI